MQLVMDYPHCKQGGKPRLVLLAKQFWVWISLHCCEWISAFPGEQGWILLCLAKSWHKGLQVSGQRG